jgi:hypothetical protein
MCVGAVEGKVFCRMRGFSAFLQIPEEKSWIKNSGKFFKFQDSEPIFHS